MFSSLCSYIKSLSPVAKHPICHSLGCGVQVGQTSLGCLHRPLGRVAIAREDHVFVLLRMRHSRWSKRRNPRPMKPQLAAIQFDPLRHHPSWVSALFFWPNILFPQNALPRGSFSTIPPTKPSGVLEDLCHSITVAHSSFYESLQTTFLWWKQQLIGRATPLKTLM